MNMSSLSSRNKQTNPGTYGNDGGIYIHVYMCCMGTERKNAWIGSVNMKAAGEGFLKEMLLRDIQLNWKGIYEAISRLCP